MAGCTDAAPGTGGKLLSLVFIRPAARVWEFRLHRRRLTVGIRRAGVGSQPGSAVNNPTQRQAYMNTVDAAPDGVDVTDVRGGGGLYFKGGV